VDGRLSRAVAVPRHAERVGAGDAIDLATERQDVRDYLNAAIGRDLDMGVDAVRLDTLAHMERSDAPSHANTWTTRKPSLFVFGWSRSSRITTSGPTTTSSSRSAARPGSSDWL
jgi:glycosidase